MAHATALPTSHPETDRSELVQSGVQTPPVSPGKVAMWLFLATEVMFFTALIGSYIVLRAGSPPSAYSNLFPPATDLTGLMARKGVKLLSVGPNAAAVTEVIHKAANISEAEAHHLAESAPHDVVFGVTAAEAEKVVGELEAAGAKAEVEGLKVYKWHL